MLATDNEKQWEEVLAAAGRGDDEPLLAFCAALREQNPHDPSACLHLGDALGRQGRYTEAVALYHAGLVEQPDHDLLHCNLAAALLSRGDIVSRPAAYAHAKRSTVLNPANPIGWLNLAACCTLLGYAQEGEQAARKVLELQPDNSYAWNSLAGCLRTLGRVAEAVAAYRQAVRYDPQYASAYSNLLLTMQADPATEPVALLETARAFADRFERPLRSTWPLHTNNPAPWRKLRVGFISPDLNSHAVMYFAEPLFCRLDRRQFEICCYALQTDGADDPVTVRVQRVSDRFVYLGSASPEERAERILADRVDILIDLAGHTARNGLLTMARKPAPVQLTWLGYPGTTGLSGIDWRITDNVADPTGTEWQYTERLARIPAPFCVYRPWIRQPLNRYHPAYQVQPAPVLQQGYITFGSCNTPGKLTPAVLAVWGRLLQRVPTARLLLEGQGFDTPESQAAYRRKCEALGIPLDRLELLPRDSNNQYLTYHRIDIALDPFPLTGGTTSFDVLWMGLPLVTMQGDSFRSRMSMSLLTAAGLTEWIARDEEEYVEIAVRLASDIPALNARRMQQRQMIEASPLMDEPRFVRLFEEALRQMWLKWCAGKVAPDNPADQFQQWLQERPEQPPAEPLVFLAPGERVGLAEARKRLQLALETTSENSTGWQEVISLATLILESIPKEPAALAALAEAEYAQQHTRSALTYMTHALEVAPGNASLYQRLAHWHRQAGNEQAAETIIRLMQQRGVQANTLA